MDIPQNSHPPSKGEFWVGIDFNPSGDDMVGQIKRKAADLIDLTETIPSDHDTMYGIARGRLKSFAQTDIKTAAMHAVKAATKR